MAVSEHGTYGNIELQKQDDDYDAIYENVETNRPRAQENDPQKILQSGIRRYKCVAISFGLLCAVLTLISIGAPLYVYQSNRVERDRLEIQLQTRHDHLTEQKEQLQASFDQLNTSHNKLTEERDDMKMRLCESPGWQKFDRGCYYISTEKKNWEESRQWCRDRQSDLIVIKSKEKQDFVKRINKKKVWLGLTDKASEKSFKWVDGTQLTTPKYWESDQPNNVATDSYTEQDCVEFFNSGWNDRSCSVTNIWICERVMC